LRDAGLISEPGVQVPLSPCTSQVALHLAYLWFCKLDLNDKFRTIRRSR
jgi:hypothetical protein